MLFTLALSQISPAKLSSKTKIYFIEGYRYHCLTVGARRLNLEASCEKNYGRPVAQSTVFAVRLCIFIFDLKRAYMMSHWNSVMKSVKIIKTLRRLKWLILFVKLS